MRRVSPVQRANLRLQSAQRLYTNAMARYEVGDETAQRRLSKASFLLDLAKERLVLSAKDMPPSRPA